MKSFSIKDLMITVYPGSNRLKDHIAEITDACAGPTKCGKVSKCTKGTTPDCYGPTKCGKASSPDCGGPTKCGTGSLPDCGGPTKCGKVSTPDCGGPTKCGTGSLPNCAGPTKCGKASTPARKKPKSGYFDDHGFLNSTDQLLHLKKTLAAMQAKKEMEIENC